MYDASHLLPQRTLLTRRPQMSSILVLVFLTLILSFGMLEIFSAIPLQAHSLQGAGALRFVASSGTDDNNDCAAKATPCKTIQQAIVMAAEGDEIHVAAGTYRGSMSEFVPDVGTVRASLIITKNITALLGGYSADFGVRNPDQHVTTLDGSAGDVDWMIFTGGVATKIDGFTLTGLDSRNHLEGGAIQINAGSPTFSHNRIVENHSPQKGGGIYVSGGKPVIASNQIYSNSALGGGGIYILTGTVLITDNQIFANVAQAGDGGGIYMKDGTLFIANNTIAQNQAISGTTGRGGGILVRAGDLQGIRGNTIYSNQSSDGGSGIELNVGTEIYGNILHHNQVLFAGSALLIERTTTPVTLINNLVYKNLGTGITVRDFSSALIGNNTSHQNQYVSFGGPGNGIDVNASITPTSPFTATLFNNLLTNNAQCGIEAYNGITVEIDYNDIFNNKEDLCNNALSPNGTHNLNVDPSYIDPANDNYRPLPGTAVVDKGTPTNAPALDLLGNPRPYGNGFDMGAIEAGPATIYLPLIHR